MELTELQVGKKIEIVLKNKNDLQERSFISRFDIIENDTIQILAPLQDCNVYQLQNGTNIEVFFISKLDLYRFEGYIKDRGKENNIPYLIINRTSNIERIQRRQFYRYEKMIPVKYKLTDQRGAIIEPVTNYQSHTKDLSGGGICLYTNKDVGLDSYYEFEIDIDKTIIKFIGRAVRKKISEDNNNYKYELGIWFKKITNLDRETIIRYIFIEQRKLRKKGLV
jgi:c-di-GMP-binding flagellar brake protein YcgR